MPTWELWTCGGCGGHEYEELSQRQRVCKFCHAMHDDVEEEDEWGDDAYFCKGGSSPYRTTYYTAWNPYPREPKVEQVTPPTYYEDWNPYPREEEECRKLGVLDRIRAKLGIDTIP